MQRGGGGGGRGRGGNGHSGGGGGATCGHIPTLSHPSPTSSHHSLRPDPTAKGFNPDILVNVAGILSNNKLLDTTPEEWQKVHAVNLDGPFYLTQACLPHMKEQGWGRIVNISSCE